MNRLGIIIILVIGGLIADGAAAAMAYFLEQHTTPTEVKDWLKLLNSGLFRLPMLAYGFSFAIACRAAFGKESKLGFTEILGHGLLCPLFFLVLVAFLSVPFIATFFGNAHIPIGYAVQFLSGALLALIAKHMLFLRVGVVSILLCGVISFVSQNLSTWLPIIPFPTVYVLYSAIALVLAISGTAITWD